MNVSSAQNNDTSAISVDVLQKAIEVNQREALKIIENAIKETEQSNAQKTGLGRNLNITG
jgi:hypothetical protein